MKFNFDNLINLLDQYLEQLPCNNSEENFSEILSFVDTINEESTGYITTFIIVDPSYLNQQFGKSTFIYYFQVNTTKNFLKESKNEPTNKFCWLLFSNQGKPTFDRFCVKTDFSNNTTHQNLLTLLTFPQEKIRSAAKRVLNLS